MIRRFLLAAALVILAVGDDARAAFPLVNDSGVPSAAPVVRRVVNGVVNIAVRARVQIQNPLFADPFFRRFFNIPEGGITRETQASGSGVIVDAGNGYVLTNNHVVEHADIIQVTLLDRRSFRAKLVGRDPATDIAVLQISGSNLTAIPMGDSDKSEVGDYVLAIGNPFGLGQTVTSGIVSATRRSGLGIEGYEDFIQTDASINPGNSGGALIDLTGHLIGINTAIVAPSGGNVGVGFAVPIDMARAVMREILRTGKVSHGTIGVAVQALTPDIAEALHTSRVDGALIRAVQDGSPAALAGLRPGDVIIAIDGTPVAGPGQFNMRIGLSALGTEHDLRVDRGGVERNVRVRVTAPVAQNAEGGSVE